MALPDNIRVTGTGPGGRITLADIRNAAGGARRPPVTLRPTPFPWGRGPTLEVDRYSLNPLIDIVLQLPGQPNPNGGERPRAFSTGDLPVFTASGVDVDILRWVPWSHRHSAAATPDRAVVFQMVEDADLLEADPKAFQNTQGTDAWQRYRSAVWAWATAPKPAEVMSAVQFEEWDFATGGPVAAAEREGRA